jgi:putative ABC transport system permease protein
MNNANSYPIDIWGLLVALLLVVGAAGISALLRLGVAKSLLWAACRSLFQLCAMGLIIQFVITQDNWILVFSLLAVMLVAAVQITLSRANGVPKGLALPVFLTLAISVLLMLTLVAELVIRPQPWYAPQLVIPVAGMMLGNAVSAIAVALTRFFEDMDERRDAVETMLALGATPFEAARPSLVSSVRTGLIPTVSQLASSGIVTIPGMMAGQVIAGADPLTAAKYQFVVLAAISALTLVADMIIMLLAYRRCFTSKDQYVPVMA